LVGSETQREAIPHTLNRAIGLDRATATPQYTRGVTHPDPSATAVASPTPPPRLRRAAVFFRASLVRFVVTGGLSAAVDTGTLWLLHGVLGVWLPAATFAGVILAFVVNFLLSRGWVFAARGSAYRQLGRYLLLAAANWTITVGAVAGLVGLGIHYLVARVAILAVMTAVNFVAYRAWVFASPPMRTEATETV
jgi:putative flippase GtrA